MLHDTQLGVDFVLRVASALKAKPQGPQAAPSTSPAAPGPASASAPAATSATQGQNAAPPPAPVPAPWRNPFLPPDPELTVGCKLCLTTG